MKAREKTDLIVVHCSATRADQDIGAREIRRWHVEERGWSDIGYHFVIRRDGTLESGRNVLLQGAHEPAVNAHSIGVCLVGGIDDAGRPQNNFTAAQFATLKTALTKLWAEFPTVTSVCGHKDVPGVRKACPSFDVAAWIEATFHA